MDSDRKKSLKWKAHSLKGSIKNLNFKLDRSRAKKREGMNYHNGNKSRGIAIDPMEMKKTEREHCAQLHANKESCTT